MNKDQKEIYTNNIAKELSKISQITASLVDSVWIRDMEKVQKAFKPIIECSNHIAEKMHPIQEIIESITKSLEPTFRLIDEAKKILTAIYLGMSTIQN